MPPGGGGFQDPVGSGQGPGSQNSHWWQPAMQFEDPTGHTLQDYAGAHPGFRPDWHGLSQALGPGIRGRFNATRPGPMSPGSGAVDFQALSNQPMRRGLSQGPPGAAAYGPGHGGISQDLINSYLAQGRATPNPGPRAPTSVSFNFDGSPMAYDGPPADVGRMQVNPAGPRPNTVGSGSPDPNASTGPPGYGGGGFGGDPYGGGGGYGSYGNPGSGYSPYPGYGQDMGYGRNPWTMTWGEIGGQYTPTLDPMTVSGLYNTNQYVNSGMGLGSSQQYINDVLSGRYTNPNTNPGLQSIYSGMLGIKNDQDALAQRRIGSSLAAGGNALSGARLEQEGRYANLSNANFNRDWGNILSNQYSQERGYQQQAPGMQENLARTALAGYGQQTQQGMIPWEVQNQNYQNQYNDWRNATSNMYRDYTQGGQTFKDLMAGRYQGFAPPNYGESAASGWAGLLSGLLGGGNGQGGGLQGLLKALGLGNNKTSPGSGSQSGGGGTPGRDANGRTPGQMGYDPTTDPGSSQSQWSDLGEALTYYGLSPDEINMVQTSGIDPGDLANYLNSGGNIWDLIGNQQQGPDYPYGGEGWTDPTGGFGNPYGDGGGDYTDYANGT